VLGLAGRCRPCRSSPPRPATASARIFESFGVECVVRGGQTANPSTGELVAAIHQTEANEVLVLANNANVELAAEQAADLADHGKHVVVVPTRNALEGFAALLVLDPQLGATENREVMLDAARAIQTIQVTAAARDARIGDKKVKKGHTIALGPDDGLLAVHKDRLHAALAAIGRLQPGFELVTLYHGEGAGPRGGGSARPSRARDVPVGRGRGPARRTAALQLPHLRGVAWPRACRPSRLTAPWRSRHTPPTPHSMRWSWSSDTRGSRRVPQGS
jgi:hypothetical protein